MELSKVSCFVIVALDKKTLKTPFWLYLTRMELEPRKPKQAKKQWCRWMPEWTHRPSNLYQLITIPCQPTACSFECHQQAGWQVISACWHHSRMSVYSDKITSRAMSWWGHGGTLYLGVKTLTNLLLRLRTVERSKCTGVCRRSNQRVDLGPWQRWWHNDCRIIIVKCWFLFI